MEVVQLGFGIVVIASVAQGVYKGNVTCVRNGCTGSVGDAQELAVGIIAVVRQGLFLRIGNSYNVALQVRDEVVKRDCTVYCTGACPPSGRPYWAGLCLCCGFNKIIGCLEGHSVYFHSPIPFSSSNDKASFLASIL